MLCIQSLVGTCDDSSLGSDFGVVREEETTFTGVDHLVALATDGTGNTLVSRMFALPVDTEGVCAVLQKDGIVLVAKVLDGGHVSELSTHVGDQDVLTVGVFLELLLQVYNVDDMVLVRFDVDGLSVGMFDSRRDGTEREGIGQDLSSRLESGCLEQEHQGRTARVKTDAVLESCVVTDLLLAHRDDGLLSRGDVVTVQTTSLHEFQGFLLTFLWDRVRCLDITGNERPAVKLWRWQ
mmetsp:Transcript_63037/g.153584  ORF Transcript_63037/g.153584 Transcript_63037/m.153584 type:complete len:237 (-) Transcript_63037:146-856(-)